MFKESYERRLKGNSLILTEEDPVSDINEFEERMVTENEIRGLIPCHSVSINGVKKFSYDITSKQSLENLYEERELKEKDIKRMISGIIGLRSVMEEYLLSEENIILKPGFVYADPETKIPAFIFYPYYKKDIHESLMEFGTFLLEKTDHNDEKAVSLVYGFYKNIVNEDYAFEKLLYSHGENNATTENTEDPAAENEIKYEDRRDILQDDERNETFPEYSDKSDSRDAEKAVLIISSLTLIVLILFVAAAKYTDISSYLPVSDNVIIGIGGLLGALSVSLPIGVLIGRLRSEKRIKSLSDIEQEVIKKKEKYKKRNKDDGRYWGKTGDFCDPEEENLRRIVSYRKEGVVEYRIDHTPFILGKDSQEADGKLFSQAASRMHARITRKKDDYYITDLNSTNGTVVNGKTLTANESVKLMENDEIMMAGEVFYFR